MTSFADFFPWISAIVIGPLAFLIGKAFTQSEKVLDQKRKAYEAFIEICPCPNEAHLDEFDLSVEFQRRMGILTIYGSHEVINFAAKYFDEFARANDCLAGVTEAGHPFFLTLMTHYNRMIWAMRNDAMTWSVFAPSKKNREYQPSFPTVENGISKS